MSRSARPNPFQVLSRGLGSPLGAFHRSNAALMVAALLIHCGSLVAVWVGEVPQLGFTLMAELAMVGLVGLVAAVGTIRHQTRAALHRGGWDELLVTPLSDREIINGQLLLALRPYFSLVWLSIASPVVLIILLGWSAWDSHPGGEWVEFTAVTTAIALIMLITMGLVIYILCIGSLLRTFGGRRHIGLVLLSAVRSLILFALVALLTIFIFPFAWVILVAFAWVQHRTLCCSMRHRLLEYR